MNWYSERCLMASVEWMEGGYMAMPWIAIAGAVMVLPLDFVRYIVFRVRIFALGEK